MAGRLLQYLGAAFNARPKGMFVPPNWVGLAVVGLLAIQFWPLLIVGLGLELAYLFALVNNKRFRAWVDSRLNSSERQVWDAKIDHLVEGLDSGSQIRYRALEDRCRNMVKDRVLADQESTRRQLGEALGRLVWVYLQLLVTRSATSRLLQDNQHTAKRTGNSLHERQRELEDRLRSDDLDPDLRRSLEGQLELVNQRLEGQREARAKIDFIDAELTRVEEQVHLVREQAVLASDPDSASSRIDAIQSTLGSTTQWIRDQKRLSGELADALEGTPPPVLELESEQSR